MTTTKSYGPEPAPSSGWRVVPDIGEFEHLRKAFEAGNGYALVIATMHCAGYVLPEWIARAWETLSEQCMNGALTWNEALAPRATDGHKVTVKEHTAYMKNTLAIHLYRQHRTTIEIRRKLGKPLNDPLYELPKDTEHFKAALAKIMKLPPATAFDVYNRILPKAEHYPYKSRKRAVRKGG